MSVRRYCKCRRCKTLEKLLSFRGFSAVREPELYGATVHLKNLCSAAHRKVTKQRRRHDKDETTQDWGVSEDS